MSNLQTVLKSIDGEMNAALERLFELVRIKSISTDPQYASSCRDAAKWLVKDLKTIGFKARSIKTAGHPMVIAHHHKTKGAPTVLFYGHYDVQPADPLELWDFDPFDPKIAKDKKNGAHVLGRGTSDDKGQLMTFVEACRQWKAQTGTLPVNITILFEGEEESGSPSLRPFLKEYKNELKADIALVCDTTMWDLKTPAICTGLRGLVGEEVTIHGADRDLHSGLYGSAAQNANHVLANVLAGLHDKNGKVTLDGFYEGVPRVPKKVLDQWKSLKFSEKKFLGEVGLKVPAGEKGKSVLEMLWTRPTAEINGVYGGYTGEGFKTVIPAQASAKISFRLVGTQDPKKIRTAFRKYVKSKLPADCKATFEEHGGSPAIHLDYSMPELKKAADALKTEWGKEAAIIGLGGSIPVVGEFQQYLGMNSLMIGFAHDDDRIHSPNEKYNLKSFHKGTRSWARILQALS